MTELTAHTPDERPDNWVRPGAGATDDHPWNPEAWVELRRRAFEALDQRMRPPAGIVAQRWSAADGPASDLLNLNELLPLVLAWRMRDPAVAQELVLSALTEQDQTGALPAAFRTDGYIPSVCGPWPLVVRAALRAWEAAPNPAFLAKVMGPLEAYVEWALTHFDPGHTSAPRWSSAEESFIPALWTNQTLSVEVTAFLVSELDAILALGPADPRGGFPAIRYETQRSRLRAALESLFWSERLNGYRDRSAGGDHLARATLGTFAPLLLHDLPPDRRAALVDQLLGGGLFGDDDALPLWQSWPEDIDDPPCPTLHQAIVLEMLGPDAGRESGLRLRDRLARAIDRDLAATGAFPSALAASDTPTLDRGAAEGFTAPGIAGAALAVLTLAPLQAPDDSLATGSTRTRWLERHRLGITWVAVSLILAGIASLAVLSLSRRTLPGGSGEALVNLARECYRSGNVDEAIRLYEEFLGRTRELNGNVEVLMGNALFRKGRYVEAEKHYREALKSEESSLHALYNLGQALERQKRYPEAAECFEAFAKTYRTDFPDLAVQSRLALEIVRQRAQPPPTPPPAPSPNGE